MITNEDYLELIAKWEKATDSIIKSKDASLIASEINRYKAIVKKAELENDIMRVLIARMLRVLSHLECEKLKWSEDGRLIIEVKND